MNKTETIHLHLHNFFTFYIPVERNMSAATIRTYKQSINSFRKYLENEKNIKFKDLSFNHFSKENVVSFLVWLRDNQHVSTNTLNLRLTSIKTFVRYCGEKDISLMNYYTQLLDIHKFTGGKNPAVEYLTEIQLKLLFTIPDMKTRLGRRNRFLMIIAYEIGARIQELLSIKICDIIIAEEEKTVRIRIHGKGNKIRYIPLLSDVKKYLDVYLREFHPLMIDDEYLFYTIHNGCKTQMKPGAVDAILKKYAQQALARDPNFPQNLHEHMLRHSIAMAMYKKGIPLSYIRDFLGHSSYESTRIYAYADEETIKASLEAVGSSINETSEKQKKWKSSEESLLKFCGLV